MLELYTKLQSGLAQANYVVRQERAPHPLIDPGKRWWLERAQITVWRRKNSGSR